MRRKKNDEPMTPWTGEAPQDGVWQQDVPGAAGPMDEYSAIDEADGANAVRGMDGSDGAGRRRFSLFKKRRRAPSFVLGVILHAVRIFVIFALILCLSVAGTLIGIGKAYVDSAPELDLAKIDEQAETSFFYDRNGKLITDFKGTQDRIMVSIRSMPDRLQKAFVAVEDARFFTHGGVDVKRIVGAFVKNFMSGSQQGGSTITQQLIKNTVLSNEISYKRKIQEAYLAMQLEQKYSKQEILESYLNTIYLGENYYGVKVAAMGYFGKELNQLTLRECAMLAGMTTNPYYYNARRNFYVRQGTVDYRAITENRTNYVLRKMYENQFISQQDYAAALDAGTATVLEHAPGGGMYPYAHYVEYAISDVVDVFLKMKGLSNTLENRGLMEKELRTGGYKVYLAIDTDIQKQVEQALENYKDYPKMRNAADSVYRSRNKDGTYDEIVQPQAAAAVLDYRTGELVAVVGGRTPPTRRRTLNRAYDMNMPVGSAIKPLSVYGPAFELGASPASVVFNMPVPIAGWRGGDGRDTWPRNYGGAGYKGPETMREAVMRSSNVDAAQALTEYVGVERSYDFLLRMGIRESRINKTPFGLSLGSSGISPIEMAVAFGVLGNQGVYQQPITTLGIMDRNDKVMYDGHQKQERRQVFSPGAAYMTVDVLKDAVRKGSGKNAQVKGQTVAGKTGTNSEQRGVFFSGLTGWYSTALWIGHDNYKELSSKTSGGNSAAKLWSVINTNIHQAKGLADRDIIEASPESLGLVKVTTCTVSGQLATEACRHDAMGYGVVTDYWRRETAPTTQCQMHRMVQVCQHSNMLAGRYCPQESLAQKAIIILPGGHPMARHIGTQYESALVDYLGAYAAMRFTGDANQDQAMLAQHTCPVHQTPAEPGGDPAPDLGLNTMQEDAVRLLEQASALWSSLPPEHPGANGLLEAINGLNALVNRGAGDAELVQGMGNLTTRMAQAQAGY